ncbi:polysaccharide biosynthesis/export family protein [Mesorhizobium sp. NPDC059025]|uniref:polysaccharide biosynthesis/export family protein n=1 Tax=unclassified Mesorhizobium TaxID=325217 RepID=UPI003671C3D9
MSGNTSGSFQATGRVIGLLFSIIVFIFLSGCLLPAVGPTASQIIEQAANRKMPLFALVNVGPQVFTYNSERLVPSFAANFGEGPRNPDLRIAVGDVVSVNLWEAPPGNLFGGAIHGKEQQQVTGSSAAIPPQTVAGDGTIAVPYVGRIKVAGHLPSQVEHQVISALGGKAVQPQALVTVQQSTANTVAVTGEVAGGARVALSAAGERILDAIAAAGGLSASVNESVVYLTRRGATVQVPFQTIVNSPRENIHLRPGDVVTVVREPRTYAILGATGQNAEVPFAGPHLTMANAVARVGGLLDNRADNSGVFLFRYEPPLVARRYMPQSSPLLRRAGPIPVVYRFDLRDANTLLIMQNFEVQPRDVIYVANASGAELQKFMSLFQGVSSPAMTAASIGIAAAAK